MKLISGLPRFDESFSAVCVTFHVTIGSDSIAKVAAITGNVFVRSDDPYTFWLIWQNQSIVLGWNLRLFRSIVDNLSIQLLDLPVGVVLQYPFSSNPFVQEQQSFAWHSRFAHPYKSLKNSQVQWYAGIRPFLSGMYYHPEKDFYFVSLSK